MSAPRLSCEILAPSLILNDPDGFQSRRSELITVQHTSRISRKPKIKMESHPFALTLTIMNAPGHSGGAKRTNVALERPLAGTQRALAYIRWYFSLYAGALFSAL